MNDEPKDETLRGLAPPKSRQPIFLMPPAVLVFCGILLAIQAAMSLFLNDLAQQEVLTWFAFVPYRLLDAVHVEGGWLPLIWTPFTHALLHAGWEHVILNTVWFAVFATPLTQRYGAPRMFILFFVGAAFGAVAFAATTLPQIQVLLGASGGIAALTGAAMRFIFQPPVVEVDSETGEKRLVGRRLATLPEFFANSRARNFSLIWVGLNAVVPLVAMATQSQALQIAWQTHLAGFIAGLLLVPLLERRPS